MNQNTSFIEGKIMKPLVLFAFPVLLALFLQAMYGAVDLLVVGKFASSADVSAVSTGSQIMTTLTNLVSSFAMGTTILLGQQIGRGEREEGGRTVGTSIILFAGIALILSIVMVIFAPQISEIMNAPQEAFHKTVDYIRICGGGMLVIVAYNLIGFGAPIALQDLLVSVSFLIILAIVNSMGAFCVRVPVSYMMSIQSNASLFRIGLATPMSSILQLILCVGYMQLLKRRKK